MMLENRSNGLVRGGSEELKKGQ